MTPGRRLNLELSVHKGRQSILVQGWTRDELRELAGLTTPEFSQLLAVYPSELVEAGASLRALQPVAGRFEFAGSTICFIPRFPLLEGISYSLLVDFLSEERQAGRPEVWTIQRPAQVRAPSTDVVAVYPTTAELPLNVLKLYIHFSSPMSEGWATRAIHVCREDNNEPLDDVFLNMEPELWDLERRRLTLLLDPGRIKRGLVPNEEAGYPLLEGVSVVVVIDPEFRDATGQPLRNAAERRYEVGPPVRVRVDPKDWRYHYPTPGRRDPLTVQFDRSFDHALLEHSLWVNNAAGVPLTGQASVGSGERSWRFEPQSDWEESRYIVMVDPRLEDLAGNSLIRVFDRDLTRAQDDPADDRPVAIGFTCALPATPLHVKCTKS